MMTLETNVLALQDLINQTSLKTGLNLSLVEKDIYVTEFLKRISKFQYIDGINVYFKGGTSIYKRSKHPLRFSEDIDLTLEVDGLNRSQIKKQLNIVTKNFEDLLPRTTKPKLITEEYTYRSAVQTIYDYHQLYNGMFSNIKVEARASVVSEPYEEILISSLIYPDREFKIKAIDKRRVFTDKIFSVQNNLIRRNIKEVTKHIFDIYYLVCDYNEIRSMIETGDISKFIEFTFKEERLRKESKVDMYIDQPMKLNEDNYNLDDAAESFYEYVPSIMKEQLRMYMEFYNSIIGLVWRYIPRKNDSNDIDLAWG